MTRPFKTTAAESAFLEMESQWCALMGAVPIGWADDFAAMEAEHQGLLAQGEWVSGPADLLGIIGRGRRETYHSAVLAWLMDPGGRHRFGARFLQLLLETCFPGDSFDLTELVACAPATEVRGRTSRADIVVSGPGLRLVVEVKINAVEGHQQCQRLFDDHDHPEARFVFLTPKGRRPRSGHPDTLGSWVTMSFRQVRDLLAGMVTDAEDSEASAAVTSYLTTLRREFR